MCVFWRPDVDGELTASSACLAAAAAAVSDTSSQHSQHNDSDSDDVACESAGGLDGHLLTDVANDEDIDENLFDGDDLDIVEQQLIDSLELID